MTGSQRLFILAVVIGGIVLSLWRLRPPQEDANGFSTAAALKHVQFIASETHPVGVPHHRAVCEYLLQEFARYGYDVEQQNAISALPISNVLARKSGDLPGNKAVLLAAHYDSVRMGPGAGDDAAAVGALLEVARIMAKKNYHNDVIFLITDGEELGLYGAREFVARSPWAKDIGVVLNFDARGSSGPSIMYETSDNDGWLIDLYAQTDPHPVCASFTQDVYRLMPNKTDFTIFRQSMPGLNFAFIGDYANYHTAYDDAAHLDVASMRHDGLQALALADKLAQLDLSYISDESNEVYFDVLSQWVVHYSHMWAPIIAIATAIFACLCLGLGFAFKAISFKRVATSLGLLLLNLAATSGVCWGILWATRGADWDRSANLAIFGLTALACAISAAIFFSVPKLTSLDLAAAGMIVWILATLTTGVHFQKLNLQGFSYLTAWPLLFSALGFGLSLLPRFRSSGMVEALVLAICSLPTILLLPQVIYLAFLGLRIAMAPLLIMLVVLAMWLLPLQLRPAGLLQIPETEYTA